MTPQEPLGAATTRTGRARATLIYVGPLLLWMIFIFACSTDVAAAENTRPAVGGIVRRLLPGLAANLSERTLERIDWNVRKACHIGEYAILAIFAYRAVTFGRAEFSHRQVVLPFLIGVLYAASDEYHQSFYPSRSGAAADVTFDTLGVSLGLLFCLWHRAARPTGETDTTAPKENPNVAAGTDNTVDATD
jgi:VanZ family protein